MMSLAMGAPGVPTAELNTPSIEYAAIVPHLVLIAGAFLLLLSVAIIRDKATQGIYAAYTSFITLIALVTTIYQWVEIGDPLTTGQGQTPAPGAASAFGGAMAYDKFSVLASVIILISLLLSTFISHDWLKKRRIVGPELYVLAMLAATGAMFMAAANDLIVMFLGLEILSIALYVLAGFNRRSDRSREAALKYLLLGGFASAIFLYGVALVYGAVGSTNMSNIGAFLADSVLLEQGLLLAGIFLIVVGLAFKVAAVPFHQWAPDVYEGSPTPITAFMATVAKTAAFVAFVRLFSGTFFSQQDDWQPLVLSLALLTLLVGSVVACVQQNVKRMLAYSSISHAGFILVGAFVATSTGAAGSAYYLLAYAFMASGSFAIVSWVAGRNDDKLDLSVYRGLGKRNPGVALAFSVLLFAQAGVPLTAGFLAKFYVISAAVQDGWYWVGIFAMLMAAVAAFFYLRVVITMWLPTSYGETRNAGEVMPPLTWLAVAVSLVFTIGMGVAPPFAFDAINFAREAVNDLFPSATSAAGPR